MVGLRHLRRRQMLLEVFPPIWKPLPDSDLALFLSRFSAARNGGKFRTSTTNNNQMARDIDPLKIEFRSLVDSKKPTGDTVCLAKLVNVSIRRWAVSNALADEEGLEDDDEAH
ncbi:hypothetical protein VP01_167g4 [Puccinia sorghi]|uniref:Uncharacterized protein n=1 Tax=Puccinia sorghi TaxID=27349 RepID=A0A0L6VHU4_9BASI|nr:hypothetical protein VP01_167g4 [Puccinia sorghi]